MNLPAVPEMTAERRSHAYRAWTLLPLVLTALITAACALDPAGSVASTGNAPADSTTPPSPVSSVPGSSTRTSSDAQAPESVPPASGSTPIRVMVGGRTFSAELYDNPTARDLAAQLPLSLTFDDLHGLEKTGPPPRALSTDGAPGGSDPHVNEIGYYAPGRDLVLYYGDVGYFSGIIRIGRFRTSIDSLRAENDGFSATIERA